MTPEEASKILGCLDHIGELLVFPELIEAAQLGKEALKALKSLRIIGEGIAHTKLPGETKE